MEELVAYCWKASMANEEVDIGRAAFKTSLNIISNMVCSKDLADPYEDSCKEFKELVGNITMEAGKPNMVDYFPVLKKMDPQGKRKIMTRNFGKLLDIFDVLIKERLGTGLLERDDVLDVCLKINQDNPHELSRTYIKILLVDLFVAGTDSSSNTLEWAMTEVLRNPHAIIRAKEELEEVIGKGKIVNEDDVLRLPYLSCIVKETLRLHPAIPFLIPRKVENEVELHGCTIPKGTQVLVNAYAIGRDPTIWEDSEEFKPERFLTGLRDVRGQDFELIPFGAGRRMCPGLPLAIRVIPMMLGSLLNNFDWNIDTRIRSKEFDMAERFGLIIRKGNPLCLVPFPLN